ncbi:hypothetical protein COHA_008910 [Chlorella ohadii]|uniref:Uncharacterized protein n=1 Tax=Chlorella ohadii TaxID=2649997 RepID=A0AAD5DI28_9CHLO|nr:hypothetical protein COHA_008910 [Chlorella ohadii]
MVGDSQEQLMDVLAAAMTSPSPQKHPGGVRGTQAAAEGPPAAASPPPPTARGPAAAAFAAECRRQGVQAHPQLLDSLERLEPEAYAPLMLHQRPGEEVLPLMASWRVMRLMSHLKRLVLADNPMLGRDPAAPSQCLGPRDSEWLGGRLLQAASLELLDLRRTGFGNAAYSCLLYQLAHYDLAAPVCEEHGGCRASLRCLKLGPPADQTHFGEDTVGHLQQVLRLLPHLEAVEVEGLTPEAIGALLPAWQEALQQRGHQGCTIAGEGGGLRFARVADGQDGVAAERLPTEHAPLQPLPPQHLELDDAVLPLDTSAAAGEVQQALPPRRSQQHAPVQLVQQQLTTHLAGRVASGAGQERQAVPRQQRPRVPGQGLPRRPAGGSGGFGSYWDAGPDEDDAFQEPWPASARQGGGSRRAAGAGVSVGQPGAGAAPRQRRRRQGGGSSGAAERMYRGGRREDELPDGGMDLLDSQGGFDFSQDEYESEGLATSYSREDGSGSEGEDSGSEGAENGPLRPPAGRQAGSAAAERAARHAGGSGIEGDHFSHIACDDKVGQQYEKILNKRLRQLKEMDKSEGQKDYRRAKALALAWSMAPFPFDRKRWIKPPKNGETGEELDTMESLSNFLELNEILDRYRLHFPFPPMPPEKRQAVLAWRAKKQAAEAAQQAQQRGQAAAAQAERPHKKLRRAGEVEQDALRDAMEDGSPPPATLGTQRHKRKQQQVLSDSDSEGEGGEEEGSEDSRPLALRAQQRSVARTPAVQLLPDSEDNCPLQQQQQQQPKKQRQGPGGDAGEQQHHHQSSAAATAAAEQGGGDRATALAFGLSPQADHAAPAAYRPSQLAAVAEAEAEAAVAAAVQQLRLAPDGGMPEAPPADATTVAAAAAAAADTAEAMRGVEPEQSGAAKAAGQGAWVTVVGADGELYVPDS